jgi:hypothetical protein
LTPGSPRESRPSICTITASALALRDSTSLSVFSGIVVGFTVVVRKWDGAARRMAPR